MKQALYNYYVIVACKVFNSLLKAMTLSLMVFIAGCTTSPPQNVDDVCEIFDEYYDWYSASKEVEKKYGVPIGVTMAFIHQESRFVEDARPPREWFLWIFPGSRASSAYGYTQALDGTWTEYQRKTDQWSADRDDFTDAVDFVGWYNSRTIKRTGIKRHDAYRLYLAYHDGAGGYLKGTYKKKPWLMKVSRKVDRRAKMYNRQLVQCRSTLDSGWLWRTLFGSNPFDSMRQQKFARLAADSAPLN
ncbi:MAG: transglycosylase SLT domain-containing protein [Oleispira antarctica]|nr:transglycosylase SLT domain-containing protein [Oleispira antarctica]MBQ0793098.1 transglycosylase SLT domain-containing protein [Oleispira antarctica]